MQINAYCLSSVARFREELQEVPGVEPAFVFSRLETLGVDVEFVFDWVAKNQGKGCFVHTPFRGLVPASLDGVIRQYSQTALLSSVAIAGAIPSCVGMLSHSFLPEFPSEHRLAEVVDYVAGAWLPIIRTAHALNRPVAIENTFERDVGLFAELRAALGVGVVIDAPRLLNVGGDLRAWLRRLQGNIVGLHIYGRGALDEHLPVSADDTAWLQLVLEAVGDRAALPIMFDVPTGSFKSSIDRVTQLASQVAPQGGVR